MWCVVIFMCCASTFRLMHCCFHAAFMLVLCYSLFHANVVLFTFILCSVCAAVCASRPGALERNLLPLVESETLQPLAVAAKPVHVAVSGVAFPHPEKVCTRNPLVQRCQQGSTGSTTAVVTPCAVVCSASAITCGDAVVLCGLLVQVVFVARRWRWCECGSECVLSLQEPPAASGVAGSVSDAMHWGSQTLMLSVWHNGCICLQLIRSKGCSCCSSCPGVWHCQDHRHMAATRKVQQPQCILQTQPRLSISYEITHMGALYNMHARHVLCQSIRYEACFLSLLCVHYL